MITENKEKKNAWIVKSAENVTSNIQVEFFQTYEDAYAFMEKEARAENKDGELSIDEMGASVYYTNGDYEYWEIEEIDLSGIMYKREPSGSNLKQYRQLRCVSIKFSELKLSVYRTTDVLKSIICRLNDAMRRSRMTKTRTGGCR